MKVQNVARYKILLDHLKPVKQGNSGECSKSSAKDDSNQFKKKKTNAVVKEVNDNNDSSKTDSDDFQNENESNNRNESTESNLVIEYEGKKIPMYNWETGDPKTMELYVRCRVYIKEDDFLKVKIAATSGTAVAQTVLIRFIFTEKASVLCRKKLSNR